MRVERGRIDNVLRLARLRYRMRGAAHALGSAPNGNRSCGLIPAFRPGNCGESAIELRVSTNGRPFFAGLARCSSVWECPVCAPRIQSGRAAELVELNRRHVATGGEMYLATLTLPHTRADQLREMRKTVSRTWQRVCNGAPWKKWRRRLALGGSVRALEVTTGPNGWHPHLHVALYTAAPLGAELLGEFTAWLSERWARFIVKAGYRMPSDEHGVRVEPLRKTNYLAKMGLADEISRASSKEGRDGHRTPFQVLRDIALGEPGPARDRDVKIWRAWARGIRGARQLTFSRGLTATAAAYAVALTRDDADLPDTQSELEGLGVDDSQLVRAFSIEEWRVITSSRSSVALRVRLLAIPLRFPSWEWEDQVIRVLDAARGLEPVPF